jgi:hypothetical protein
LVVAVAVGEITPPMPSSSAVVAFVGADEPSLALAASFLRSGAIVRLYIDPQVAPARSPFLPCSLHHTPPRCFVSHPSPNVFVQADGSAAATALAELGGAVRCGSPAEAARGERT